MHTIAGYPCFYDEQGVPRHLGIDARGKIFQS
jgi:hypothetical protein